MSKRFTDTEKWEDPWFGELPNVYKMLWMYLCDTCDNSGVWKPYWRRVNFLVGESINPKEAEKYFEKRVVILHEEKWFIRKFVQFQYGQLTINSPVHRNVLRLIDINGLWQFFPANYKNIYKENLKNKNVVKFLNNQNILHEGFSKGSRSTKDKDKEKESIKTIKTKTNGVPPKYCHDCEKYFQEHSFEKHLHLCRKKVSA